MTFTEIHSLIGPYALDALDAEDRALFEAHLGQCPECRDELDGFLATAARLGDVPAQAPPAALRQRLMTAVARTPQERPVVASLAGRSRLRRALPRLAVAAVTLVALGGLGAFAIEYQRNNDLEAQQTTMTRVFTAADARRDTATLKSGGMIQMIKSDSVGGAVLIASDLPAVPGKTYQLWTITGDNAHSEGLIGAKSTMLLMNDTRGADAVAITIEPAGGSKSPTSPPIASMPV